MNIKSLAFELLNKLIPKNKYQIVIHTTPDFCDMSRSLASNISSHFVIYILTSGNSEIPAWAYSSNIKIIKKSSFYGVFCYMSSKYSFFTHGLFSSVNNEKQITINLWHGMPLKLIGYDDQKNNGYIPYCKYSIATSTFYRNIISKAFGIKKDNVFIAGLPRNDILLKSSETMIIKEYLKNS